MKKQKFSKLLTEVLSEWKWLSRYIRKYWWSVALHVIIGVIGTVMGLGTSVASKFLIDAVVNHNRESIFSSAALAVCLAVSQILITAAASRISSVISTKINTEIRADFFADITSAQWEDISKHHSGELINRLEGDIGIASSGVVGFLPGVVTRFVQFAGSLAIVLYYDATMAVLALIGAPLVFFSSRYMMKKIRTYNKKSREMNGKILSAGEDALQNLQTVKAFGLAGRYSENFKSLLLSYRSLKLEHDKFSVLTTMCLSFVGLIVSYSCYGWGVWRLWQGLISYGTMTMFIQLSSGLTSSFSSLVSLAPSAVSIATSAGRIKEISELPKESDEDADAALNMLKAAQGGSSLKIDAHNVNFSYKGSENAVLHNADFYAKSGETVGIIGPSGEGKTTMLRLILGLIKPQQGEITFSSENSVLNASCSTRRLCSYVPQSNDILSGTVADNLRAVCPDADDVQIINALKIADAWSFVSELPNGINTAVGERGMNFSEGQAQRIAIARAVLRKAPVLLMDEATSALDSETEARVLKNLMVSDPKRICIITTHRPSMLEYCTRIYRINDDGSVEVCGN